LLNLWGGKKSHALQKFQINLTLYVKNTTMWHERMLEMKISMQEEKIRGFRKCGSSPTFGHPELLFWKFI
jgi:hypothetical protein